MAESSIKSNRLENEFERLRTLNKKYHVSINESLISFSYPHRDLGNLSGELHIPNEYPFRVPTIKFIIEEPFRSNFQVDDFLPADFYLEEPWSARHTFRDIIEKSESKLPLVATLESEYQSDELISDTIHASKSKLGEKKTIFLLLLTSIVLRLAMGLGSYSGKAHKPRFGDYEAQRHWMELTTTLSPSSKNLRINIRMVHRVTFQQFHLLEAGLPTTISLPFIGNWKDL